MSKRQDPPNPFGKMQRPKDVEQKPETPTATEYEYLLCECGDPECSGSKGFGVPQGAPSSPPSSSGTPTTAVPPAGTPSDEESAKLRFTRVAPGVFSADVGSIDLGSIDFSGVESRLAGKTTTIREMMEAFTVDKASMFRSAYGGAPSPIFWSESFSRTSTPPPTYSPDNPPESYTQALEEVQDWITEPPATAMDDIVGNEEALAHLRDAIEAPVLHAELYAAYDMQLPKGALLSGPPGCGKTMFAKAAAAKFRELYGPTTKFLSVSGSELQSKYVGETEEKIKAIFNFAREYQRLHGHPLLVFMDEAEVMLPDRTGRTRRVAPWEESQVATFLAEMDGVRASGAFMLLASNRPEVIDQAVLRDGRCDLKIVIRRPTPEALESILQRSFRGILHSADASPADLVFAALESLLDPHKIILEAHALRVTLGFDDTPEHNPSVTSKSVFERHFLLEHIVSGAMAVSVAKRAKRYAFARDKLQPPGTTPSGVSTYDVTRAVTDIFEENKKLDHSFALAEFRETFMAELAEAHPDQKFSPNVPKTKH